MSRRLCEALWVSTVIAACSLSPASDVPSALAQVAPPRAQVAFPVGYRGWAHVKSKVILKGHPHYEAFGGIHHVYANEKALRALQANRPFAKGSVLVFDLLQERLDDNAITEGPRKVIGVMEKDADRFPGTAGWGFEDFKGGDAEHRSVTDAKAQCFSCHETQKASDYVYSSYRP